MLSFLRIVIIGFICFCIFGIYASFSQYTRAKKSSSWPTAIGLIINTDIIPHRNSGDVHTGPTTTYQVYVKYRYEVDGTEFTNSQISFPNPVHFNDRAGADTYISFYPVRKRVTVYYDLHNPRNSCLEPGGGIFSSLLWTVIFLILLIGVCLYGLRIMPTKKETQ